MVSKRFFILALCINFTINIVSSITIDEFLTGATSSPGTIVSAPDGNLWFTDISSTAPRIGKVTPQGNLTFFSNGLNASSQPFFMIVGPDNNLWFSDISNTAPAVGKVLPQTGAITEFSNNLGATDKPFFLINGPNNKIYFSNNASGVPETIGFISTSGIITKVTKPTVISLTLGLAIGSDNNVWFTVPAATGTVGKLNVQNNTITNYSLAAGSTPQFITRAKDGNLWVTDIGTVPGVWKVTPQGNATEYPIAGSNPLFIIVGPDPNFLWVSDQTNNSIYRVNINNGAIQTYFNANMAPLGLIVGPDNNIWFSNPFPSNPTIGRLNPITGQIDLFGAAAGLQGNQPLSLAVGPDNNIWFTDSNSFYENPNPGVGRVNIASALSISKTSNSSTVRAGKNIAYTITVTNNGNTAQNVTVTENIPQNTSIVSIATSQGSCNTVTGICSLGQIESGQNATINLVLHVGANFSESSLTNTASVTADNDNPFVGNKSASAMVTVLPSNALTKMGPTQILAGSFLTYQLQIQNLVNENKTVHVTDTLPEGVKFISASDGGTLLGDTVTFDVSLAGGEAKILTIKVLVNNNTQGVLTNTFEVNGQVSEILQTQVIPVTCNI